ncbi:MAG: GyrI-like domain-containing protein [Bacteroidetes bacterium]|nr:GyrI-like domain-containing protein [Bacteroidota bacterium]
MYSKETQIRVISKRLFVGKSVNMSLLNNKTGVLWSLFGPLIYSIPNRIGSDRFSLQVYDTTYFERFDPEKEFKKWALVEVSSLEVIPNQLESFVLPEGKYAVFTYRGLSSDTSVYQYIFSKWLMNSDWILDDRPHFEVLGSKYKNDSVDSEEDIWIPIKKK